MGQRIVPSSEFVLMELLLTNAVFMRYKQWNEVSVE